MARWLPIILGIFLISCHSEEEKPVPEDNCTRDWNEIKQDSVITVLAENSPLSYFIYRGKNMGYEYELLYQFAKDMNVRIQVKMVHDLDKMYDLLDNCEGDIIACNATITEFRDQFVNFSTPHITTRTVLVQRLPENYKKLSKDELNDTLIQAVEGLKGKKVHVWKNSSHYEQLTNLNKNLKLGIEIVPVAGSVTTEEMMKRVSEGEIDYTIADDHVADIGMSYYRNLDASLTLGPEEEIAFALRIGSPNLLDTLNQWLNDKENASTIGEVKRKYFDRRNLTQKANTDFSSILKDGQLSPYDDIIKKAAGDNGWDWRLIAAIIYQESKFETWKVSWAGAFGLFQFMPATAVDYGIGPNSSAEAQINAGVRKLTKNYWQWNEEVKDSLECIKFTLANFNAGRAHIDDARRLCEKHGKNQDVWDDNVNMMLLNLSKPEYYRDDLVKHGYCRGVETYEYVIEILARYDEYKAAFPEEGDGNL